MSKHMKEYIYVFKLDGRDGYEIYSHLLDKMPEVARCLTASNAYLIDWNFDDELKYLFVVVKCCCREEENIGLWLHGLLEKLFPEISIEKRRIVSSTKRIALNGREKLLASIAASIIKIKRKKVEEILAREGIRFTKPELSAQLLLFSYLSRGFSETLSEVYVYFYPHFLEKKYTSTDITIAFQEILREGLIVKENGIFKLTERGNRVVKNLHSVLEKELETIEKDLFSRTIAEINADLKEVIRRNGEFEDLSIEKILALLLKCGIEVRIAFRVLNRVIAILKIIDNGLSRDDIIEAVKLALDHIDKSRLYSSRFEFYMNTIDYLLVEDEEGKLRLLSTFDIKKMLMEKWFIYDFKVDEAIINNLASKVFEDLRLIYLSASPQIVFLQNEQSIAKVSKSFIEHLLDSEVRIQLPHYYKIVKSEDPTAKKIEIINQLTQRSISLFKEALIERDLRRVCDLFNVAAYNLVTAFLLSISQIPTIVHVLNCNILMTIIKKILKERRSWIGSFNMALLDKMLVFTKTALRIYYLDLTREVEEEEEVAAYVKFVCKLGLEISECIKHNFNC